MRRRDLGLRGGGSGVPRGVSFSRNETELRAGDITRRIGYGIAVGSAAAHVGVG